jgi:hypothetical protein
MIVRLPDFICAGAQKSGTTWLYTQLSRHPQIFLPRKELNVFSLDLPCSRYAEEFRGAAEGQHCGDISPGYAAFPGLAERIHLTCPNALILHLLRNPVDRAFSQWKMARHLGNIDYDIPFIEAFRANLQYMRRRGEYSSIVEEYAAFYSLGERLAVFWYEDIKTCPMGLMRDLMTFLRVDAEWASPDLHAVVSPNPDDSVIGARDAVEVSEYYAPFDRQLRSLLGIASLPWSYSQS